MATQQIVLDMQATNPGADPLREVLTRYGTREVREAVVPAPPAYQQQPPYQAPPAAAAPVPLQPRGPVQQQNLPPPR
jgi:hypothetical protein